MTNADKITAALQEWRDKALALNREHSTRMGAKNAKYVAMRRAEEVTFTRVKRLLNRYHK